MSEISPEVMVKKKNVILDATTLTTLMSCGTLTDYRFNHNFTPMGGKSNSLEVGSLVHIFLETYYEKLIEGINKHDSAGYAFTETKLFITGCPECIVGECKKHNGEYLGLQNTPIENQKSPERVGWQYALDSCQAYLDRWRNDSWTPVAVEKVLGKELYQDDEIRIMWKAKLDLLMDTHQRFGIVPMDHKTMKQKRSTLSLNNQFIGQCILSESHRVYINKFGWQKTLSPEEKFVREPVNYTMNRINEWRYLILPHWAYKLLEYEENEYYPPNWSHCTNEFGRCIFHEVCDADPNDREYVLKQNFIVGKEWDI